MMLVTEIHHQSLWNGSVKFKTIDKYKANLVQMCVEIIHFTFVEKHVYYAYKY